MNRFDYIQLLVALGAVLVSTPLVGIFIAKVYQGEPMFLTKLLRPIEKSVYKLAGVNDDEEMNWQQYTKAVVLFSLGGFILTYAIQAMQHVLPLNPQSLPGVDWHLAFNTAISFVSNTNWQAYSGETTMSYLTQMAALTVQNFLSAATGISVLFALIRGLTKKETATLGNFWVDMTRSIVYILLPMSVVLAVCLVGQGVVQNFNPATQAMTVEGGTQVIPQGPAASQIAIKQLGTNGGGYFNANSAHPFENPTPLTNFIELISILLIPAGLTYTFGLVAGNRRQGWVLFTTMMVMLLVCLAGSLWAEYSTNPVYNQSALMEGKETRFGITNSVLWSVVTTAASSGSVNAMHASLSPLSGGVALLNIMFGEIVFGGVGSGLYGMLLFVILTVFLSGLMVGRTPEYLGKKIEARDVQMAILAIIAPSAVILVGTGISLILPVALASLANKGPHGLSEILYAFTSAAGNNGSAFAGLNVNTVYYNVMLGIAMLIGRFAVIVPVLAIAGNMGRKKIAPPSFGTFTTDNWLFVSLLTAVIVIVGALTFFPALSLGPIVEHLLMLQGKTF
jgi:K+-transporting ATPase ATPase A chain